MNKNPIAMLDSLLADYASPRTRRLIHFMIAMTMLIVSALLVAEGDWKKALLSLAATLYAAVNKANTGTEPDDLDADDGLSYEEAGGQPFPEG